jgi:diadenosine tetraphosphate (Ap4A) HIT family hydrolase
MADDECLLCRVADADAFFGRRRVWEDEYWRLSVVLHGAVAGFAHLEPRRHIPYITDLDGPEAATLGAVLARVTAVMRTATAADKIYVYVFGDRVPHLHLNLAPQRPGGPLVGGPGLLRPDADEAARSSHDAAADAIAHGLATPRGPDPDDRPATTSGDGSR